MRTIAEMKNGSAGGDAESSTPLTCVCVFIPVRIHNHWRSSVRKKFWHFFGPRLSDAERRHGVHRGAL